MGTRCRDLPPRAAVEAVFTKAFPITIEGSPETLLGIHHVGFCIVVDGETFMLDFAPLQFYKRHYARRARGRARWDAMMDSVAPELVKTKPGSAQRVPETCVPHIRFTADSSQHGNACLGRGRIPASTPPAQVEGVTVDAVAAFACGYLRGRGSKWVSSPWNPAGSVSCAHFAIDAYRALSGLPIPASDSVATVKY